MQLPPNVRVFEIAAAAVASRALWAAAELGVADHLEGDARAVDDLAAATAAHAGALYRVLRLLATYGIFREHDGRRFSQTEMSVTLVRPVAHHRRLGRKTLHPHS
jgi:hypothetical protein